MSTLVHNDKLPALLLRIGLAAVFLYATIASLLHPLEWEGFLPSFTHTIINPKIALNLLSVYEITLAAWLLSGKYTKYAAAFCALTFLGIIGVSINQFIITFRDVGLLFAALALFFLV
jgi:uncharacterized membrane protein YphA (DoxX/SURF4 family)